MSLLKSVLIFSKKMCKNAFLDERGKFSGSDKIIRKRDLVRVNTGWVPRK